MDTPTLIRERIIAKYTENVPQTVISRELSVPKATVCNIIKKFRETASIEPSRRGRCGRRRLLTTRDVRMLSRASIQRPQATSRQLQQQVGGSLAQVSLRTVRRELVRCGRIVYRLMKAPSLTNKQMKARLLWARAHVHWTSDQWRKVGYCVLSYMENADDLHFSISLCAISGHIFGRVVL